jgi:hypothetical protein
MRASWKAGIAAAGLGLCGAAAALAQSWTITIGPDNKIASTTLQAGKVNIITQDQATVSVQCPNGADCTKASLRLALTNLSPTSQSFTGSTFAIPKAGVSGATNLVVAFAGSDIGSFQVGPDTGGGTPGTQGGQPPPSTAPTVAQLLALPCPGTFSAGYDEKANQGEIVVTPLGVVLASGLDTLFDENDTLIVRVVADQRLLPLLTVARTSAFRTVTAVNILGAGETVPTLTRQAGLVAECGERRFSLDNFSPGQGKVQISALQGTQLTPTGSFDFNVNPLYTGMLTLGAARTNLVDPGFKLATVNGQTVIAAGEGGSNDLVYTLFYTPFVWGKRDVQKRIPLYKHLNPTIGVAPEDLTGNAFVGITADLPAGFTLTYGRHFRQIEVLTQGLTVGTAFAGTADQIPTSLEWKNGNFWAVSIDIRAMVQILRAALGAGGGGGGGS